MAKYMTSREMAKIASPACAGCGKCCRDMGDSIHLDPYDIHLLTGHLSRSFEDLLDQEIGLCNAEGLALPHLLMDRDTGACPFLRDDGLCRIHPVRPGFCRLFPLGRNYTEKDFSYFVVEGGCPEGAKTKIRISRWLEIPDLPAYEAFVFDWHELTRGIRDRLSQRSDPALADQVRWYVLQTFYARPFESPEGFYSEYAQRAREAREIFHLP